jgi:hypothetical protein
MTNWIEEKAAQIKKQKGETQKQASLGPEIVDRLESIVRQDVDRWNELNPNYRRKIDGVFKSLPSGGFKVLKTSFPPASVETIFDPASFSIQVESSRCRPSNQETYTVRSQFRLVTSADGGCQLCTNSGDPITIEEASRILLEGMIEHTASSS